MVVGAEAEDPSAFASLPVDLLCSVAEELDAQSLAIFAAACSACRAVAHEPLGDALLQVLKRCLSGVRIQPWSPDRPHFTSAWETETFKGCGKNLKLLLLGNLTGVTSVGDNAFRDCSSLSKCVLPSGLVTIGTNAFELCTSLTELTLPATLTSIGDRAFAGCSSLTSLTFPASVVTIGHGAFFDCSSLTIVDFSAATDANIGRFAFVGCERLVKLTLPAALSRINNGTFSRCSALVELTLPITVTSIGTDAFDQCTSLAELTLPATLTSIGDYAFSGYTPPSHLVPHIPRVPRHHHWPDALFCSVAPLSPTSTYPPSPTRRSAYSLSLVASASASSPYPPRSPESVRALSEAAPPSSSSHSPPP